MSVLKFTFFIVKINSRYDNHSPPSTTARNGSTDNQECGERNGSANTNTQEHDDDIKTENDVCLTILMK